MPWCVQKGIMAEATAFIADFLYFYSMAAPKKYRMDKTAFRIQTFEEADNHYGNWEKKSYSERLDAAFYLICTAYGVKPSTKLNRTVFSKRKHN